MAKKRLTGSVQLAFRDRVNVKDVHAAIDRILGIAGCPTCGLLGLDLHLHSQPVALDRFRDIKGVMGVGIER